MVGAGPENLNLEKLTHASFIHTFSPTAHCKDLKSASLTPSALGSQIELVFRQSQAYHWKLPRCGCMCRGCSRRTTSARPVHEGSAMNPVTKAPPSRTGPTDVTPGDDTALESWFSCEISCHDPVLDTCLCCVWLAARDYGMLATSFRGFTAKLLHVQHFSLSQQR